MIRRGYRSGVRGNSQEYLHPNLRYFFPLGDTVNEPFAIGGDQYTAPAGTVIDGPRGKAREFSSGNVVTLLFNPTIDLALYLLANPWTVMFFINLASSSSSVNLFYNSPSGYDYIGVSSSSISYVVGGSDRAQASVSLSPNTWYHIAISVGTTMGTWKMYLNGSPLNLTQNQSTQYLGKAYNASSSSYNRLVGPITSGPIRLDQVKVYNVQLSDADIISEMNKKYA